MNYLQTNQHPNESYRDYWVQSRIEKYSILLNARKVIDVGAGLSPYKKYLQDLDFEYFSQDFGLYIPSQSNYQGLQSQEWEYPKHDFICDVLDIPENVKYDLILCTEVFEHVPDPVSLLKKLTALTNSGGYIVVTVPFLSLMHQSPYWFSSGLSPFWFEHWSKKLDLEICELEVSGDYVDLMEQEIGRLFSFEKVLQRIARIARLVKFFRKFLPIAIVQSGGFGTFCVMRKK